MKSLLLSFALVLASSTLFSQIISAQRIAQADDVWKEDVYLGVEQIVQLRRLSPFYFTADSTLAPILEKHGLPFLLEDLDSVYRKEIALVKQWYFEKVVEEAYWNQGYRYVDAQLEFDKLNIYPQVYRVLLNPAAETMGLDRSAAQLDLFSERLQVIQGVVDLWSEEEWELIHAWSSDWATLTKKLGPRLLAGLPTEAQEKEQALLNALLLWNRFRAKK